MQSTKRPNSHDQYWRLSGFSAASKNDLLPLVKKGGYTALPKTITKDTVLGYAYRIECEQLCYFRCSDAELKRFVRDRGIDIPEGRFRRSTFIELLEEADEELAFTKFTDLPPELRTIVYDYYLAEFSEELRNPVQPPLTRVCRLLRTATLPVFYDRTIFYLRMLFNQYSTSRKLQMTGDCPGFVLSLAVNAHSMVRKIRFDFGECSMPSEWDRVVLVVLGSKGAAHEVTVYDRRPVYERSFDKDLQLKIDNTKEAICQVVEGMVKGKTVKTGFAMDDIYALRAAIEKGWRRSSDLVLHEHEKEEVPNTNSNGASYGNLKRLKARRSKSRHDEQYQHR
ncbi:hypothetical protein LTR10_004506 [Elasticomyces elasticus]|nr:hypothetical protein LTR10_004506 [Elasticomyces elasticus]KAK4976825.1 hypothetical protein LTR42_002870 [Elasticomyces elasticus]